MLGPTAPDQIDFRRAKGCTDAEWLEFLLGERSLGELQPPSLPDQAIQRSYVGSAGRQALEEACVFYSRIRALMSARGNPLHDGTRVLDFGCGWGRVYRFFLRDCEPQNLIGVDIDDDCIYQCRASMPFGSFHLTSPAPPAPLADASFDLVFAYSVFSHLARSSFEAWLSDISRLLRVRGLLVFTTLKPAHLDVWRTQSADESCGHYEPLGRDGFDYARWKGELESGGFLHVATGGGGARSSAFYGESTFSEKYLTPIAVARQLRTVEFSTDDRLPQSFVVLERADR